MQGLFAPITHLRTPISKLFALIDNFRTPMPRLFAPIDHLRTPMSRLLSPIDHFRTPISEVFAPMAELAREVPPLRKYPLIALKSFDKTFIILVYQYFLYVLYLEIFFSNLQPLLLHPVHYDGLHLWQHCKTSKPTYKLRFQLPYGYH